MFAYHAVRKISRCSFPIQFYVKYARQSVGGYNVPEALIFQKLELHRDILARLVPLHANCVCT